MTAKNTWIDTEGEDGSPLNINLLIPFKDNKGDRRNLYLVEIERFKNKLYRQVEDLKEKLIAYLGSGFEVGISARSDGATKKYYWRFTSSARDRKYKRLDEEDIQEYISSYPNQHKDLLYDIEEELIYINANLRLIKGILDSMQQCTKELENHLAKRLIDR